MSTLHTTQFIGAGRPATVGPAPADTPLAQLTQELQTLVQQPLALSDAVQRALQTATRFCAHGMDWLVSVSPGWSRAASAVAWPGGRAYGAHADRL